MTKETATAMGTFRLGFANSSVVERATSQPVKAKKTSMKGAKTSAGLNSAAVQAAPSVSLTGSPWVTVTKDSATSTKRKIITAPAASEPMRAASLGTVRLAALASTTSTAAVRPAGVPVAASK